MAKQTFELRSNQIAINAIEAIRAIQIDPKKPMIVEIRDRTRTLDMNRKLWALLKDISSQVVWHGRSLSSEDWKHIFSAALEKQDVVPNLNGDGFVVLGKSTSRMSVRKFSDLLELIQAFGVERSVNWSDESKLALELRARFGE